MLAIQLLFVLLIFLSSHAYGSPYEGAAQWARKEENSLKENETLRDLEDTLEWREIKRLERMEKLIGRWEAIKKKIDEMVLEDLKTIVDDYKKYNAIGSNWGMTLGEYRAALRDFDKKHPGRISYFESMRGEMKRKLVEDQLV